MSNIFNELYRGNLSPADKRMVKGSEMARAMKELSDAEEVLERMIPPELRPVPKRMADAQITVNGITAEAYFIDRFKPGARLVRPRPPLPGSDPGVDAEGYGNP